MTEDKWLSPEEIKDTRMLQLFCLVSYMKGLGYTWYQGRDNYFGSDHYKNKARKCVSFSTAVKLYNGHYTDWHGHHLKPPFDFDVYSLKKAEASKILRKLNLQLDKKTGFIKAQSNIVQWVDMRYYDMFMQSKYFPFS